jgi:hypothetical protein
MEIALARRIQRIIHNPPQSDDNREPVERIHGFLDWYLRAGREFYLAVQTQARKEKDLTVSGLLSSEAIAETIYEAVMARQPL